MLGPISEGLQMRWHAPTAEPLGAPSTSSRRLPKRVGILSMARRQDQGWHEGAPTGKLERSNGWRHEAAQSVL